RLGALPGDRSPHRSSSGSFMEELIARDRGTERWIAPNREIDPAPPQPGMDLHPIGFLPGGIGGAISPVLGESTKRIFDGKPLLRVRRWPLWARAPLRDRYSSDNDRSGLGGSKPRA